MKRIIMALCVALISTSVWAQIWDSGVVESRDEFTGAKSCYQRVDNGLYDDTGISLALAENGREVYVYIVRQVDSWSKTAFNMFGLIANERVYVRFGEGDVLDLKPVYVEGDMEQDKEIAGFVDNSLAARIMAAPNDIRVRFDGPDGRIDFTVNHGVAVALAEGFGKACFPQ